MNQSTKRTSSTIPLLDERSRLILDLQQAHVQARHCQTALDDANAKIRTIVAQLEKITR